MGSSPVKVAGIFAGEGEDRVRVGSDEAAELEAEGKTITRTAADNPDKEQGAQQIKNLGKTYAEIDAEMQDRAEGKETLDPSQVNYRKKDNPDLMIRMMSSGPLTAKNAEKTIRKHENLKGGNPMVKKGKSYYIDPSTGEKVYVDADQAESGTVVKKGNTTTITMTPEQYKEYLKKQKK